MQSTYPCIWFDREAEEAARFYASVFPDSHIGDVAKTPDGDVLTVDCVINGQRLLLLNGGPQFKLSEAFSLVVPCDDQAETDRLWETLTEGGEESQCGWLKDRYGLSWQIVPTRLLELLQDPDPGRAQRATQAMLGMRKIVIDDLERAADGVEAHT